MSGVGGHRVDEIVIDDPAGADADPAMKAAQRQWYDDVITAGEIATLTSGWHPDPSSTSSNYGDRDDDTSTPPRPVDPPTPNRAQRRARAKGSRSMR